MGIPVEYYHEHLSNEMLEVWNEAAKILEEGGATVKQVSRIFLIVSQLNNIQFYRCQCQIQSLVLSVTL